MSSSLNPIEDASATFRGFRRQALYILSRLLVDDEAHCRIYRPEGSEDLLVFDASMKPVEVVQIKDHKSDLSLSRFKPNSPTGFFSRLRQRRKDYPECITKIASYGPLGPELQAAINGEIISRESVVQKLNSGKTKLPIPDIEEMLDSLKGRIERPIETELHRSICESLQETIVSGELECSIGLLMYWIYKASEEKLDLTRHDLLLQIEHIGRYLADHRDSSTQWGINISPISKLELQNQDIDRLIGDVPKIVEIGVVLHLP